MGRGLIHCGRVPWQRPFAEKMLSGLRAIGIDASVTASRSRESDIAILLGTTLWRGLERDGGRYMLVDRCSFGDTNKWVSLVWDGHGRRGNHMVPSDLGRRWEKHRFPVQQWQTGNRVVLCGQTETYSPQYKTLGDWYGKVTATHFRRHPAGTNPTGLPEVRDFADCKIAVTLNSSVAVDAAIAGVPVCVMDEGGMAWDVGSRTPEQIEMPDREPWLRWLVWTQWTHDEIAEGHPIKHLFEDI